MNLLKESQKAPDFSLKDKDGKIYSLADFKSKFLVLYFYPKDNTSGCTIEANEFNKKLDDFKKIDTSVVGISGGDQESKTKFCHDHDLQFLLLSDPDFSVCTAYGIYGEKSFMGKKFMGIHRVTYVLNSDKKVIKVYEKVEPKGHADEVYQFIADL